MSSTIIERPEAAVPDGRPATNAGLPPRPSLKKRFRADQLTAWGFIAPVVAYLVIFYAYPLFKNVDLSVRDYTVRSFIDGNAPFVGFANFTAIFQNPTFGPALVHTLLFTGISIAFQFTIGMALAVFFFQNFRLSSTLRALFLVPWLLPLIVSASTWSWMMNSDSGVINSVIQSFGGTGINWLTSPHWALVAVIIANIWIGIPFNLVILYSGLQNISTDIYEAASLDGANASQKFWRITFPLLKPVSAITILLGLVYTLKVFDIIWIMTKGGPGDSSTTFAIWSYQLGFGSTLPDFSPAAAVGNLLIVIALIFGFLYLRVQKRQDA
ncbi:multiple sugar transport system permease protein [Frondihabitans sp. PhB188]|uniref:carbohydrate ABC transporter permease n=1 Tax=Frondihabitans sp. PhB188 TaxID=2485200 RepID=UPI000F47598F|nr:sugar ABC transporter permease [Frondihabitans sp. PhB188]ROQ39784.1 multiple sugar transport system permease protein [Frondihabitans sp. PhB188]